MTAIPATFDRYTLEAPIGEGGMGVVWRARRDDGVLVAIKVVRAPGADSAKRLLREARAARAIDHPNVVRVLDVLEVSGDPAIVLELLEGESLAKRLEREPVLGPAVTTEIVSAIAAGVGAAHARGIVHRDLKPENVFLCGDATVKVLDFGIAKLTAVDGEAARTAQTATGELLGTPSYMAPEQIFGEEDLDGRVDIWALGLIAYRCSSGVLPTESASVGQALKRILTGTIPPLRDVAPDVPVELASLVDRMLARERAARPASMRVVREELLRPRAERSRRRRWLAVPIAAVIAVSSVGAWWAMHASGASAAMRAARTARSIAVVGFENRTGRADDAWLATAFTEMLGTELGAGSRLRVVAPEAVAQMKSELALAGSAALDHAAFVRLRNNLGVDLIVTGTYFSLDADRVRLDVRIVEASSGVTVAETSDQAAAGDRFEMIARLGGKVRSALGIDAAAPGDRGAARSALPADPKAARAYIAGLERLRAFDVLGARKSFEEAIAITPDDPLAHAALADALTVLGYDTEAAEHAKLAFEHSTGLRREARLLVEARYRASTKEWDRAIDAYRTLQDYHPDDLLIGLALSDVQIAAGRPKDSFATITALRKLPPPAGDDPRLDLAECAALDDEGDYKALLSVAQRALVSARARNAPRLIARALHYDSWALANTGKLAGALQEAQESRRRFEELGDRAGASLAINTIAGAYSHLGDYPQAIAAYQDLATQARLLGNRYYEAVTGGNVLEALLEEGELKAEADAAVGALQFARTAGYDEAIGAVLTTDGKRLALEGRFDDSAKSFDEARELPLTRDNARQRAWVDCSDGERLRAEGDTVHARALLQSSLDMRAKLGLEGFAAESRVALAGLELDQGHVDQAVSLLRAARDAFATIGDTGHEALACAALARALVAQHALDQAEPLIAHARELPTANARAEVRFAIALADATLHIAKHDMPGARQLLDPVVAEATRLGFAEVPLEARLLLAQAAHDRAALAALAHEASARHFGRIASQARL